MKSIEEMAHEYALVRLTTSNPIPLDDAIRLAWYYADKMKAEADKRKNSSVPDAILEAESEQLRAQLLCCQRENQGLVERVNRLEREKWEALRGAGG